MDKNIMGFFYASYLTAFDFKSKQLQEIHVPKYYNTLISFFDIKYLFGCGFFLIFNLEFPFPLFLFPQQLYSSIRQSKWL